MEIPGWNKLFWKDLQVCQLRKLSFISKIINFLWWTSQNCKRIIKTESLFKGKIPKQRTNCIWFNQFSTYYIKCKKKTLLQIFYTSWKQFSRSSQRRKFSSVKILWDFDENVCLWELIVFSMLFAHFSPLEITSFRKFVIFPSFLIYHRAGVSYTLYYISTRRRW